MSPKLTTSLIATALQKLEAIHHNETEILSDDECRARAQEIAKAALEAIAVCTKFVLSTEGEAGIEGLGQFYLSKSEIRFNPESDVLAFAVAKKQDPEKQQYALRNAFVKCITNALEIIPQLEFASGGSVESEENLQERVLTAIFGSRGPNQFDSTISQLLTSMVKQLHHAGLILDPKVEDAFSLAVEEVDRVEPGKSAVDGERITDQLQKARRDMEQAIETARHRYESSSNE